MSDNPAIGVHSRSGYRPEIDGLRALAVLAVIVNHLDAALLPSGFLGVDIFFVISGYVITASLWTSEFTSLRELLATFYARRVRRLLPALLVCTVVTAIAIGFVALDPDPSLKTGLSALFGLANLRLLYWATDYFAAPTSLNAFTHTWSLGVEEQFYVGYPILLWIALLSKARPRNARSTLVLISAISAVSLLAFLLLGGQARPLSFYLMPTRIWELGAGCILCIATDGGTRRVTAPTRLGDAAMAVVLLAVIALLAMDHASAPVSTPLVVLGTVILIARLRPGLLVYRVATARPIVLVGLMSYSLYLWHWSVFSISRWTVGISGRTIPFQLLLILALSAISYAWIERPLRTITWSRSRARTLLIGATASLATALLLQVIRLPLRKPMQQVGQRMLPTVEQDPGLIHHSLPCHLPKQTESALQKCLSKPTPDQRTVFIIGDSHATNHVPSVQRAVRDLADSGEANLGVAYFVEWGFVNTLQGIDSCLEFAECIRNGFERQLDQLRASLAPGDVVVFSWSRDRVTRGGAIPRAPDVAALEVLNARLTRMRDRLLPTGATIVLVEDIPKPCDDDVLFIVDILRQGRRDRCGIAIADSRRDREALSRLYRSLAGDRVVIFDPHDGLCENGRCGVTLGSETTLLYGDASPHFTPARALVLVDPWRKFLASIVREVPDSPACRTDASESSRCVGLGDAPARSPARDGCRGTNCRSSGDQIASGGG
jgi:peptidoglycan/LPS O-acetylase OafA/YrhL